MLCALVQILMEKTKMMPGRIMVLLVVTGAVISVFGSSHSCPQEGCSQKSAPPVHRIPQTAN